MQKNNRGDTLWYLGLLLCLTVIVMLIPIIHESEIRNNGYCPECWRPLS